MPDPRIRVIGEDAAAAVFAKVNAEQKAMGDTAQQVSAQAAAATQQYRRSVGEVAAELIVARKHVGELRQAIIENADKPGFIAGTAAMLDQAIPKVQKLEAEFKELTKVVNDTKPAGEGMAGWLSTGNSLLATFGLGVSVAGAVSFGKALLEDADALTKMHDRTGISVEALQRFQIAGDDAGNTVEEMSASINKLQDNVASGNTSAVGALQQLGFEAEHFKALSPENQFVALSDAIRKVKDPAEQVQIAMDLFGRSGAAILPTLKRGFDDLQDSVVMTAQTVRALDEAGDMLAATWRSVKAASAEALVGVVHLAQDGFTPAGHAAGEAMREIEELHRELQATADHVPPATKAMAEPLKVLSSESAIVKRATEESDQAMQKLAAGVKAAADAEVRALDARIAGFGQYETVGVSAAESVSQGLRGGLNVLQHLGIEIGSVQSQWKQLADHVRQNPLDSIGKNLTLPVSPFSGVNFQSALPDIKPSLELHGHDMGTALTHGFEQGLHDLPGSIVRAIEGGGNIAASIGGTVGERMGSSLDSHLQGAITKGMSGVSGALVSGLSSMIPVAGALIGPLIGKLMSIGGPSKAELDGRKVEADFEKQFSSFDTMMTAIGAAYATTGKGAEQARADVERLMAAEKQGGEAARAMVAQIQAEIDKADRLQQHASRFGPSRDDLQQMARDAQETFDYMLGSGQYTADQLDQAYRAYQQSLADAGNEAAKAWLTAQRGATQGAATVNAALKALQDQRDALAQGIESEAPEEVMGVIETQTRGQMAALDAQITAQQANLDAQAQAAADDLEQTLSAIDPTAVHVPVVWDVPPLDVGSGGGGGGTSYPASGGLVAAQGVQYFAGGWVPRGTDTVPAMLTPGEMVLNGGQQRAIGALLRQGGLGGPMLAEKLDGLHQLMSGLRDDLRQSARLMPMQLRHALRGLA